TSAMMAGFMSYFGGRRDPKQSSRDAIVTLRQQLQLIEKKEEYLQKKIDEELKKAKTNAVANKAAATAALRRKKATEQELDRLQGTRFQLEMQVNTLESATFNAETMAAMKKAATALKDIHGKLTIDTVDTTMGEITEQTTLANEDALKAELEDLEQEELNERLMGDHVPVHQPAGPSRVAEMATVVGPHAVEADEETQLKELQAALAM
ncbi:Vacuolar-sorting protein SNF7, partial [Grifola frondosa]